MAELSWIKLAKKYIGTKEVEGKDHNNPDIVRWWKLNELKYKTDETAWCANFVGGVLEELGHHSTHSLRARSYLDYGEKIDKPAYGCIVVFWRESPTSDHGHVGFVVGQTKKGNLMVLGGNQGNQVSIIPFALNRVLGYRWPIKGKKPLKSRYNLPVMDSDEVVSQNEA